MRKLCLFLALTGTWALARGQSRIDARRAPGFLKDSTVVVDGYVSSLLIRNNMLADSIHSNFEVPMPDTTTVLPFSGVSVVGPRVNLSFFNGMLRAADGSFSFAVTDSAAMLRDTAYQKALAYQNTQRRFPPDTQYVRMTLNGKPLTKWIMLDNFPKTLTRYVDTMWVAMGNDPHGSWAVVFMYGYTYDLIDTTLGVNDQLYIEVKESRRGWLIDSYNITRAASAPRVSAVRVTGDGPDGVSVLIPPLEKKTSDLGRESRTSR